MAKKKASKKMSPTSSPVLEAWAMVSKLQAQGLDAWALLDQMNGVAVDANRSEEATTVNLRRPAVDGFAPYVTKNQVEGKTPEDVSEFLYHKVLDIIDSGNLPNELKKLPQHWRAIYTVYWLQAEVDNGGHEQFFSNGGVEYAEDVAQDLRLMNAGAYLNLFVQAWKLFDPNLNDVNPKMEPIDDAFYAQKKSLYNLVGEYVLAHMNDYCADLS